MHMKRLTTPKTWHIRRKEGRFITRPHPSGHPLSQSVPLVVLLRDLMHIVKDSREAKRVLAEKQVMIDGVVRKNPKFAVGLMDVIDIPKLKKVFRMSLDRKGRLAPVAIPASEKENKVCRIKVKKHIKGGQLHFGLHDGRSIFIKSKAGNSYKTGDSVIIKVPEQKILKHLPVQEDMSIIVTSGKHAGEIGILKEVKPGGNVLIKNDEGYEFETLVKYVLILGKKKSELKVS